MSRWLTTVVELAGVALASCGVGLYSRAAAFIVAGLYLVGVAVRNG